MSGRTECQFAAALVGAPGVFARRGSRQWVGDFDIDEATSDCMSLPGCAEIQCFRVLVPWTLGIVPAANLNGGAQISGIPPARFALAASVAVALAAIVVHYRRADGDAPLAVI